MKTLLILISILALAVRVPAQTAAVPMSTRTVVDVSRTPTGDAEADREHDALWTAWRAEPPAGMDRTKREYWEWRDKVFKKFAADALSFAEKHPKDQRRWEAIVQMGYSPPWFIKGFKPEFDDRPSVPNLIVDEAALAAFKTRQSKLVREVLLADDATARQRIGAFGWMVTEATAAARKEGKQPDLAQFEPLMVEVATKLPDERGATLMRMYLGVLRASAPDGASELEAKLEGKPIGKAMKELAAKQEEARAEASEAAKRRAADLGSIKFTAADGRPVDLAKLRGKVVLVDFWATWCGPCLEEMPNVVATYDKYHDKGFEIVGIALENSGVSDNESGDAKEKKLAAAKQKMLAFANKNSMPWPQHFDDQHSKNEFAEKYGIHAIPATFLIDQDGKIASTEARGPKLESEVKRLLGL